MKIGYIRISTKEQNLIRQEVLMEKLGVDRVYIDVASGKDLQRKEFQEMMNYVREGDSVIVESYSRLARSTKDLLNIVDTLKEKKVEFISKKENIDTSTSSGRLMMTMFAGLYQFERECMLERQAEGIAEAKKAGKYKGRQKVKKPVDFERVAAMVYRGEISAVSAMEQLNLKKSTYYRFYRAYKNDLDNEIIDV